MARVRNWPVPPTQGQPARSIKAAGGRGTAVAIEATSIVFKAWGLSGVALIVASILVFTLTVMLHAVQP